ncbi:MAG: DUF4476 domain-containing protein [Flavobacteriales bacterium]|nr:DUF4476 domain-containing protein [Flavobacteriales bacterium]MCB9334820.1 DUF4476 domain-containing protein [Flavobacteriales bacterium]
MIRSLIFSISLLIIGFSKAQTCSVIFKSADTSVYFTSSLSAEIQNTVFVNNIKLTGLPANNKYLARIKFKNDSTELRQTLFLLDAGFTHFYEIDKKGIHLKKIYPTLDDTPDPNQYLVVCEGGWQRPPRPVATLIDSTKKDSSAIKDHYQMPDYEGKVGCPYPIKDEEFNALRLAISNENLEDDKLAITKETLQNSCLTSIQINLLFPLFEFEETKFELAKMLYPITFDVDRYIETISKHLKFESHIDEIKTKYNLR